MKHTAFIPLTFLASTPALAQASPEAVGAGMGFVAGVLIAIVVGAVIGWLASLIVKGSGSGFWGDVLFGIGGSMIASYVLPVLGLPLVGIAGSFIAALIGAVILIVIVRLIRRSA